MTGVEAALVEGAIAAVSAAGYGAVWFARNRAKGPESFDPTKFFATLLVGAAIGVGLALSGTPVDEVAVETRMFAYAGAVTVAEAVLKAAWSVAVENGWVEG